MARITVIQGHPDGNSARFCRALQTAYVDGALGNGHDVRTLDIAALNIGPLRSRRDWENPPPVAVVDAQDAIEWAQHLVFIFPLWLGSLPALLKGFLEQVLRPGFAFDTGKAFSGRLKGRSARVIVTMGMPAWVYRFWFLARGLGSFEQGILRFVGIGPTRRTLIGSIEAVSQARREEWLKTVRHLGHEAR
jgi:putative NADPH-quinone reductase